MNLHVPVFMWLGGWIVHSSVILTQGENIWFANIWVVQKTFTQKKGTKNSAPIVIIDHVA